MPSPEGSPLEWFARLPIFSWMQGQARPQGQAKRAACGPPSEEVDMKTTQQTATRQQQRRLAKAPPKLCTREESPIPPTAPVSTCDSSAVGASWSEQAVVGSSDSAAAEAGDMMAFHRLSSGGGSNGSGGCGQQQLTLTLDAAPVDSAPSALPVDIPWRLVDPDSATTPMQEALSHSLAQMELRMSGRTSGRHSTRTSHASSNTSTPHHHRRTQSSLPASGWAGAADGGSGSGGSEAPSSFFKLIPPPPPAAKSPDVRTPCSGVGSRRVRGGFEGYFPAASDSVSSSAATAAAAALAAAAGASSPVSAEVIRTPRPFAVDSDEAIQEEEVTKDAEDDDHDGGHAVRDGDSEGVGDDDMIFDFEDP